MKKMSVLLALCCVLLAGCAAGEPPADIAATTLPVYDFTTRLCQGTPLIVTRLVTESVSCLHDYSLNVRQVKAAESAQVLVLSGAGLEDFLEDVLLGADTIDASQGIDLKCPEHDHEHEHEHAGHTHEVDPHIWLSPENAKAMAANICAGLSRRYPEYAQVFQRNESALLDQLDNLQRYGEEALAELSCRELITFHDGFAYFADAFSLSILEAVEEESGSEASALELIHLSTLASDHALPAVFVEANGSTSAAQVIAREVGCQVYTLDMAMAGDSYFDAMYHNIDTIKEALQ